MSRFPPVKLFGNVAPWESPQALINSPANLPPLAEQAKRTYIPGSNVQPMHGPVGGEWDRGGVPGYAPDVGTGLILPDVIRTSEDHRYATIIDTSLDISNTLSQKILDQPNGRRNFLMFRNTSATANIFIGFGKVASAVSTLMLVPLQSVIFDVVVQQDDVWALASAANGTLSFSYSNIGR